MLGVKFDDKHSEKDYGFLMNYAKVSSLQVKSDYIDIPGRSGALDLTEALGDVCYEDTEINFKFAYVGDDSTKQTTIFKNENLGKKCKIILDRDKEYYYLGRILSIEAAREGNITFISAVARCNPYKYKTKETIHREDVTGESNFILPNERKSAIPIIEVDGAIDLKFLGTKYVLKTGRYKIPEIMLIGGYNRFHASGMGRITFTYQEGCL